MKITCSVESSIRIGPKPSLLESISRSLAALLSVYWILGSLNPIHCHAAPNVLFIVADDLNCAVGPYGDSSSVGETAVTPNLDRLADRGLTFERAYCQQAVCNPSRSSFLTGLRPDTVGVDDLRKSFRETAPEGSTLVTLPGHFKNHGYFCQNIGKLFHNMGETQDRRSWSIDEVLFKGTHADDTVFANAPWKGSKRPYKAEVTEAHDVPDTAYRDGQIANLAAAMLRDHAGSDQPFFLGVGFWRPHLPFVAPKKYWDLYQPEKIPMPNPAAAPADVPDIAMHESREIKGYGLTPKDRPFTEKEIRHYRHGYYASISFMDAQIGEILDALDNSGQADDTIVVFTSDHGFHIGEQSLWGKTSNFELDARVPLIIASPKHKDGQGKATQSLAELVDLYPTLADLAGIADDLPENLEGSSQAAVVVDPEESIKEVAFTQHQQPFYGSRSNWKAWGYSVRTARWRYTEWRSIAEGSVIARELYDHEKDGRESRNLADSPVHTNVVEQLAIRLAKQFPIEERNVQAGEVLLRPGQDVEDFAKQISAGDVIVLKDGVWKDADLKFERLPGTAENPIVIRAETPGKVVLTGATEFRLSGQHVTVSGLVFRNTTGVSDVVQLRTHSERHAHHCRMTDCVFEETADFEAKIESRWLSVYGTHNRIDHCYFAGKKNRGPTFVVWVGEEPQHHHIDHNHFGPRPELGRNGGETIRIGTSEVSEQDSLTTVEHNYFHACDGEAEAISNKSCGNVYRYNVFDECSGTLTLRHGHRCLVEGNVFLGKKKSGTGGVRIIGQSHTVINNYFEGLRGDAERAAVCFMNGVPNSSLNGYAPVRDATVAHNTFVDCKVSMELGVGAGKKQSAAPTDCRVTHNAFLPGKWPIFRTHAKVVDFDWRGNLHQAGLDHDDQPVKFTRLDLKFERAADGLLRPSDTAKLSVDLSSSVKLDFDGSNRSGQSICGCDVPGGLFRDRADPTTTGPTWKHPLK